MTEDLPKLPEGWEWVKLSDVGEIVAGGTPSTKVEEYWKDEIPWITPADLSGYTSKYISKGRKSISREGLENSSAKLMPAGSVLFSSRAPIGYVVIAANPISTNQGFKNVVPFSKMSSEYIYYYLKSAKNIAENMASGTTFKEISAKTFAKIPFPLPPLPEQSVIVEIIEEKLSSLDHAVEELKSAKEGLRTYRQSVLKWAFEGRLTERWREGHKEELESGEELLERIKRERAERYERELEEWKRALEKWEEGGKQGKKPAKPKKPKETQPLTDEELRELPELPEGWLNLPIKFLCEIVDGDRGENYPKKHEFSENGYCVFLNAKNVTSRGFNFKKIQFISKEKHHALGKGALQLGDIVFTSRGTIGNTAYYDENIKFKFLRINSGMFIIRKFEKWLNANYFLYGLRAPIITNQINKLKSGTAQPQLPIREFKNFIFSLPSLPEQELIVSEIERRLSVADKLEEAIDDGLKKAEVLRQSILKKAFEGELTRKWREEHPELISGENSAEALLERIRAEKEESGGNGRRKRGRKRKDGGESDV